MKAILDKEKIMSQIVGIDWLGGQNYVEFLCENHPKGFAAGFLIKAQGWKSGLIAVRALAKTGKCPVMRLNGIWHDDHGFTEKDIPAAVKIAEQILVISETYPKIKFFYSPWLEPHCSDAAMRACRKACRAVLGKRVPIVCGHELAKGISEVHHGAATRSPYIFSFDGLDMFTTSVSRWKTMHKNAQQFYGWIPQCNGYTKDNQKPPRWDRHDWITKKELDKMVSLLK